MIIKLLIKDIATKSAPHLRNITGDKRQFSCKRLPVLVMILAEDFNSVRRVSIQG